MQLRKAENPQNTISKFPSGCTQDTNGGSCHAGWASSRTCCCSIAWTWTCSSELHRKRVPMMPRMQDTDGHEPPVAAGLMWAAAITATQPHDITKRKP